MSPPADANPDPLAVPLPKSEPQPAVRQASPEEIIYQGPVSLWMGWRALMTAGLACMAGLGGWIFGLGHTPSMVRQILVIAGAALAIAGALMVPCLIFSIRSLRYKITTRLIEREAGLLVKRLDSLDLARVKDVQMRQTLPQRILNLGTLEIYSSDASDPVMHVEDVPNPRPVYEKLRNAIIQLGQQRGVIPLDR